MSGMRNRQPKELTDVRKASDVKREDKEGADKRRTRERERKIGTQLQHS